jgi:hypothetical protein
MDHLKPPVSIALRLRYYGDSVKFKADDDIFTFPNRPKFGWIESRGIFSGSRGKN